MENKINLVELLRDCPTGMELDSTVFDNITFDYVNTQQNRVYCRVGKSESVWFTPKGGVNLLPDAKCVIFPKGKTTWEGFVPPCKFKDGDVCCVKTREFEHIFIFKVSENYNYIQNYVNLSGNHFYTDESPVCTTDCVKEIRFATEEEKQKLFDAIKANGYKWNAETKTLEKLVKPKFKVGDKIRHKTTNKDDVYEISKVYDDSYGLVGFTWMLYMKYQDQYELAPNKFDITTLKPFDTVLVRDKNRQEWCISLFSHCNGLEVYKHSCINGSGYAQCIPYNEDTKHLLGTTNDCEDYFKTWEK